MSVEIAAPNEIHKKITENKVFIPATQSQYFWQPTWRWYSLLKPMLDFGLTLLLVLPAAALVLIAAVLIKLTSRGPVFYSQTRMGRFGRPYTIYKLRSMYHNCEKTSGPCWSKPGDSRITPIGRFLRKSHLDELPQLWNVLRGEMSLVGPRPERPEFVPALEKEIPHYRDRLLVRPGITGLAQVQLPPDTDLESVKRKLAYDIYYIRMHSLWLDLRVLAGTVVLLFGGSVRFLSRLCRLPRKDVVEKAYRVGHSSMLPVVQVQPATS